MREVYSRDSSERWGRFLSVTPVPPSIARNILTPLSPREKCNTIRRECVCVRSCTDTYNAFVCALESQKYAEFREALIDVTITAIYPDARVFLRDTRTTTMPGPPRGEWLYRDGGNCWMRPSKWVPSPVWVGATMAKYKSKSRPPSFLLSFRPRAPTSTTPLSSSFDYSCAPPTDDDALSR